jgi:hypothetical protein
VKHTTSASTKAKAAAKPQTVTKFKIRCSRYLYTLTVTDAEKAEKLKQSLPPGECARYERSERRANAGEGVVRFGGERARGVGVGGAKGLDEGGWRCTWSWRCQKDAWKRAARAARRRMMECGAGSAYCTKCFAAHGLFAPGSTSCDSADNAGLKVEEIDAKSAPKKK